MQRFLVPNAIAPERADDGAARPAFTVTASTCLGKDVYLVNGISIAQVALLQHMDLRPLPVAISAVTHR